MIDLVKACSAKFSEEELNMLEKAINFAKEHHEGQLRASGEPYIIHPMAVANIVYEIGMDADSIIAAVLHDTVEDCNDVTLEMLNSEFNDDIAHLVDGVTKLSLTGKNAHITEKQEQAENFRKLFLAIAADVRVVIIKLADRLHNMRTLQYCNEYKQKRIARETLDIYAPLAHRFGMGVIKGELEDLCFQYLMPKEYEAIKEAFNQQKSEREALLENVIVQMKEKLDESFIHATVNGRPKHLYSIYRKMQRLGCSINEVYDLIAIRVIVDSINDCYATLGIAHENWKPLPGRFKDYIATPKPNMYRSLHTTLIGENGIPFEVQIRTQEMHRTAEYGIAAHWMYKEGRKNATDLDKKSSWLRQVLEAKETTEDSTEFTENILKDFLGEYVFVISPKGEIFDLPKGSTPLDFAYRIHTNIGHHCQGAKINGNIVKLDYKLKTNDIVEIITSNSQTSPKLDWLKIVKTQSARNKIKQWFKKENREDNIQRGRVIFEEACKKHNFNSAELLVPEIYEPVLQRLNMGTLDDYFAAIGFGGISSTQAFHKIETQYIKNEKKNSTLNGLKTIKGETNGDNNNKQINGVIVKGESGMVVRFGNCCNPIPGDPIIGYITRGRGVSVHRQDCPNLQSLLNDSERLIEVEWSSGVSNSFFATLQIVADNRPGSLLEISALLSGQNINIQEMNGKPTEDGQYIIDMTFVVSDSIQMDHIAENLQKLKCVDKVYRWHA